MEKYDSYKESDVKWVGAIPNAWEICEIAHFSSSKSGGTPDRNKDEYWENGTIPWMSSGEINKGEVYDTYEYITPLGLEKSSAKMMQANTVMIALNGQGKTKGMSAILRIESTCNQSLCGFNCDEVSLHYKHLYYCFQSMYKYLRSQAGDDTREGLAASDIRKERIPLPSYTEQLTIASYLDSKCCKIDHVIATQQKRVELLKELKQSIITRAVTRGINPNAKMKDSGVEWIGEIPEHWEVKKLKHICKINGRVGFKGYAKTDLVLPGEGAYTIGGKHITNNILDLSDAEYISWEKYYESPEIMVKQGDILTAQRGTLGRVALIEDNIGEATINPSLVLINNISIFNKFLYWYLVSNCTQNCITLLNTSTAVPMISQNQIENMPIALPSIAEQKEISSYINDKTSRLESSINKALRQIELLKEYKQSLITEVVTGKRKVC